ncbi:MAG: hypothetical protein AB7O96_18730 [Pseudobdellovibrionaceae bacterium]
MITLPNFSKALFKETPRGWIFFPFAHRSHGYLLRDKSSRFDLAYSLDSLFLFFFLSIGVVGGVFEFFYISSVLAAFFFLYFIRVRFLVMNLEPTEEEISGSEIAQGIAENASLSTLLLVNLFCLGLLFWGFREASRLPNESVSYVSSGTTLAFFLTVFSASTYLIYVKGSLLKSHSKKEF